MPFLLTQFMLNRSVSAVFIPICLLTCSALGANPTGLVLLVNAASLTAFLTPMATPAVPMCMADGGYDLKSLFKSGAPFSGAISFLMTSPILNPAIIALLLVFFGPVPTAVYAVITFAFAVCAGLVLDAIGFSRYIKNVAVKGGCCGGDEATWENLKGTFWQKQAQACKYALTDAVGLFKGVFGWLLLGAGIGAFIYGFVPTELLEGFAGADNLWAIPLAAVIGIPMYIRVETMIPIAGILMEKGVSSGIVIALILGGAGCSIPEVSLLNSIFKKPMVVTFVLCILLVAIGTGFAFTLIMP